MAAYIAPSTWEPLQPSFDYKNRPDFGKAPANQNEVGCVFPMFFYFYLSLVFEANYSYLLNFSSLNSWDYQQLGPLISC